MQQDLSGPMHNQMVFLPLTGSLGYRLEI